VTDAELLLASRQDPAAFRELYDRWAQRLLAYFYRRVFDAEVAADLLAETFAVAYERRHRFRDLGRPGSAWLFGIAQKELAHWVRHRAAEQRAVRRLGIVVPALDDESIARIEALADVAAQRPALREALGRMTDLERDAVQLRVLEELDYQTIAAKLGCSEVTARGAIQGGPAPARWLAGRGPAAERAREAGRRQHRLL